MLKQSMEESAECKWFNFWKITSGKLRAAPMIFPRFLSPFACRFFFPRLLQVSSEAVFVWLFSDILLEIHPRFPQKISKKSRKIFRIFITSFLQPFIQLLFLFLFTANSINTPKSFFKRSFKNTFGDCSGHL